MDKIKNNAGFFKKCYLFLGNSVDENKFFPRFYALLFLLYYGIVRAIYAICHKWSDINHRSSSIEEFCNILFACFVLTDMKLHPSRFIIPLNYIEGSFYKHYEVSRNVIDIKNNGHKRAMIYHYGMIFGFTTFCLTYFMVPWIEAVKIINTSSPNVTVTFEKIVMPFPSVSFFKTDQFNYFAIETIWQALFHVSAVFSIGLWCDLFSVSSTHLATEVKIFSFLISEIDKKLQALPDSLKSKCLTTLEFQNQLQGWVNSIIEHHLALKRAVKKQDEIFTIGMLLFHQVVVVHVAMILYCGFALETTSSRWRYLYAVVATLITIGILCKPGQDLINESEALYETVCQIQWYDKPEWFKHKLRVIMVFTMYPLKLSPAGLFVLNLRSYLNIFQAGYSYANVMMNIKPKTV